MEDGGRQVETVSFDIIGIIFSIIASGIRPKMSSLVLTSIQWDTGPTASREILAGIQWDTGPMVSEDIFAGIQWDTGPWASVEILARIQWDMGPLANIIQGGTGFIQKRDSTSPTRASIAPRGIKAATATMD
jgi:hypothetical protein